MAKLKAQVRALVNATNLVMLLAASQAVGVLVAAAAAALAAAAVSVLSVLSVLPS